MSFSIQNSFILKIIEGNCYWLKLFLCSWFFIFFTLFSFFFGKVHWLYLQENILTLIYEIYFNIITHFIILLDWFFVVIVLMFNDMKNNEYYKNEHEIVVGRASKLLHDDYFLNWIGEYFFYCLIQMLK